MTKSQEKTLIMVTVLVIAVVALLTPAAESLFKSVIESVK